MANQPLLALKSRSRTPPQPSLEHRVKFEAYAEIPLYWRAFHLGINRADMLDAPTIQLTTRRVLAAGVLLFMLIAISACGQRGDLTLPQEEPKPADTDQQAQP